MNQGIHMIDAVLYLLPDVATVQARWGTIGHDRGLCEVEDTAVAVLTFKRGTIGMIQCTTCAYNDHGERIDLHAMQGSASVAGSKFLSWDMDEPGFTFDPADYAERDEEFTGHRLLYAEVIPYFRDGAPCRCAIETGRPSVALIEAIYQSARDGGAVVSLA
jgi:predicted dehydrogenase